MSEAKNPPNPPPEDQEPLQRFRDGDPEAIRQVMGWIRGVIYGRYRFPTDVAEEIFNETLLAVTIKWLQPDFRIEISAKGYVRTIAIRKCINHIREERRHRGDIPIDSLPENGLPDPGDPPGSAHVGEQIIILLIRAQGKLSDRCQKFFNMYYWEGMTAREIADKLSLAEVTVRVTLFQGRQKFRKEFKRLLDEEGLDWPDLF